MTIRLFNLAAGVSAIGMFLVLVAWIVADRNDPRTRRIRFSDGCYLSVSGSDADARVHLFNDGSYGPYRGSTIRVPDPTESGFGDVAGIYYRNFHWRSGQSLWTLSISLAYPLAVSAVLPLVWLIRRLRPKPRGFAVELARPAV